jgi:HEPN domain-containing protein
MTREQKLYKALIKADLKLVTENYQDADKAIRLQAAYHMQQAVEKTIKLKAGIEGLNLWGHEIDVLIKKCDDNNINIDIPKLIRNKADVISHWEAECRYYPVTVVRKDSIKKVFDVTLEWLESGNTKK